MPETELPETKTPKHGIASLPFLGLLVTQFLGAVNDNMFRWLVIPIGKELGKTQFSGIDEKLDGYVLAGGLACFVLPYVIFSPWAGYLAERFPKRRVIVSCKIAEVVIMLLGLFLIWYGNIIPLFFVVFCLGTQSALFGPSKLGVIPEIVRDNSISNANGLIGLTTVIAVVVGTVSGSWLYSVLLVDGALPTFESPGELWIPALALLGVAVAGYFSSLAIPALGAANIDRPFPVNPASEVVADLKLLAKDRTILYVALGITFFWGLASLAHVNVDVYVTQVLKMGQTDVGLILGVLALGVGVGSVLAGVWSGGRVELGLVPLGALILAASSMALFFTTGSFFWTGVMMFLLGFGGGFYDVPLAAYIQHHGPRESLGSILAAANFLTFSGMLVVSLGFAIAKGKLGIEAPVIFLAAGLLTIPVAVYIFFLVPQATIRFIFWLLTHTVYKIRFRNKENLPQRDGALLVSNHVSWVDGILLLVTSPRPVRMVAYADYISTGPMGWMSRIFKVIPIKAESGPKAILKSLKTARTAVEHGELVCIFAEGQITRTGQLNQFNRGLMKIVDKTNAPIIPVYLDEIWGSIFSFSGRRFFWKWPKRFPFPVTISYGKPLYDVKDVHQVKQAVQHLGVESLADRKDRQMVPARHFIRQCRSSRFRMKVADSAGTELTGGKLLTGAMLMCRLLQRHVLKPDEKMVGILLPPSAGGAVINAAVTLSGKVAVNLNYTLSDEVMNFCIKETGITHVLTSKRLIEKKPVQLDAELVFLEDLKEQATGLDKLSCVFSAYVTPCSWLDTKYSLRKIKPDDLLTVIFTSGSTGEPKGVMLSNHNVGSNIEATDQVFNFDRNDVIMGVLPFFHSFGYTVTMWLPFMVDSAVVYHFNPLDGRTVGKLCEKYGVTILGATPTFLRTYMKRCTVEQMSKLDMAIVGAEKMPPDLAAAFKEKFGVEPTEGYGTTELSPIASFNVPDHRSGSTEQSGTKAGSVGRMMPGAIAKVVNADNGEDLGTNAEGLLKIKGPNVMLGYLNHEEKTKEVIEDGWYNTGDIARIDDEGFIEITGRQSRFSKIGGEMVPHIRIENELARIVDDPDDEEPNILVAVTSVPDAKKGERLIVFHKKLIKPLDDVIKELSDTDLPNIWLPSRDGYCEVDEIPLLGTGKLDLKAVKELAIEKFGQ